MPVVYPCPLCGRSVNRRGRPLDEPGKTKSHIDGAHNDRHDGERGENHMEEIRANAVEVDAAELPTTDKRDKTSNAEGMMVEIEGENLPITEAVKLNHHILMSPQDFGLASGQETREIAERINEWDERIEENDQRLTRLVNAIEILAAESNVIGGECPNCGGRLQIESEGMKAFSKERYAACERCERRVTV